jgi:outer membrane protein assembly factor BamD
LACFLLSSCSDSKLIREIDEDVKVAPNVSVESLYEKAANKMHSEDFKAAANGFALVQEQFPYSKWAAQSQIMEGYCRYQAHQYEDAIDLFTIFAKLHPHHRDTPYACYMIGLCHYERIAIVERDQQDAYDALKAFRQVLALFPACDYAKDAKFKIDFIHNHLAAQEMSIGRFYQRENAYLSAINRFKNVVEQYQTTEQCPEALLRLAECYATLNMNDDFFATYAVLKLNHKDSEWCKLAKALSSRVKAAARRKAEAADAKADGTKAKADVVKMAGTKAKAGAKVKTETSASGVNANVTGAKEKAIRSKQGTQELKRDDGVENRQKKQDEKAQQGEYYRDSVASAPLPPGY